MTSPALPSRNKGGIDHNDQPLLLHFLVPKPKARPDHAPLNPSLPTPSSSHKNYNQQKITHFLTPTFAINKSTTPNAPHQSWELELPYYHSP
jgi:hypothetical protein